MTTVRPVTKKRLESVSDQLKDLYEDMNMVFAGSERVHFQDVIHTLESLIEEIP